jgi:WD40 repeat protein
VTANIDAPSRVWDGSSGACLLTFKGHGRWVKSAAFSPDGRRIVTASWDKTARVWDGLSGACLLTLEGHGSEVLSAAFSPDGRKIVTGSDDRTARLWDAASGALIQTSYSYNDGWFTIHADGRIVYGGTPRILEVRGDETRSPKNLIKVD